MNNTIENQRVIQEFLASKSFDFEAFGKFIAKNGASIASSHGNGFGIIVNKNCLNCCIPAVASIREGIENELMAEAVVGG